jgi:pimeloyl-ACP methyl ester carboxylesterase
MHGFEDHYVSVTGILTRYWQAGLQGSPIILLHGIGCSVLDWEQNIASLATRHRVYALDMMGSGLTEKPSREHYTIPRLGKFVLDFLSTQEIQRAHFAGFSLGGRVVLECADIAPERVASMVLVAPAGVDRVGLLLQFRLASIPFVGEMMLQPTVANLRTFFDLAFYDQSFVTPDFVARRLKQAMLPGVLKDVAQWSEFVRGAPRSRRCLECRTSNDEDASLGNLGRARQFHLRGTCGSTEGFVAECSNPIV